MFYTIVRSIPTVGGHGIVPRVERALFPKTLFLGATSARIEQRTIQVRCLTNILVLHTPILNRCMLRSSNCGVVGGKLPGNFQETSMSFTLTINARGKTVVLSPDKEKLNKYENGAAALMARFWPILGPGWGQG